MSPAGAFACSPFLPFSLLLTPRFIVQQRKMLPFSFAGDLLTDFCAFLRFFPPRSCMLARLAKIFHKTQKYELKNYPEGEWLLFV